MKNFKNDGYVVIKNFISEEERDNFLNYILKNAKKIKYFYFFLVNLIYFQFHLKIHHNHDSLIS